MKVVSQQYLPHLLHLKTLLGSATVTAQVYRASAGSTLFTATNAKFTLTPPFTGLLILGQISYASADVSPIKVVQGDRLVMVYTLAGTGTGLDFILEVAGTASAGIIIS